MRYVPPRYENYNGLRNTSIKCKTKSGRGTDEARGMTMRASSPTVPSGGVNDAKTVMFDVGRSQLFLSQTCITLCSVNSLAVTYVA